MRPPERLLSGTGARWLFWWMQKLFSGSEQGRQLSGAFLDDYIGSRVLRREAQTFRNPGEQDYRENLTRLTNFGDEFQTIHRSHPVIRDDQIYRVFL
jgi:hypothetical protein